MTETVRRSLAPDSVIEIGRIAFPVIAPDSTVGAGLGLMLAAGLRNLRTSTVRGEPDRPETVHRFRIGLRRLRSLLSAFSKVLPDAERRVLGRRLASTAKRYGRVREWDVFLSGTVRPMMAAMPGDAALVELESCAREARRRALPEGVNFPGEAAAVAAAIDAASWLHNPPPEFSDAWQRDLKEFAGELFAKRHRRLRKRLKAVDLDEQASFHRLRIQAKKVRYPLEMFETLFEKEPIQDYLDRLITVQDALGHLNDAMAARNLVAELPLSSLPQGLASGWLAHEIEIRRHRFPPAAKKLRKASPFWED